ncbi:MAG: hypothetical protein ACRCXZ_08705, partial [Patescibacteria group bacterium]
FKSWIDESKKNNTWLIITYHKIESNPSDYMTISPETFAQQMQVLKDSNIKVLPASEAFDLFMTGKGHVKDLSDQEEQSKNQESTLETTK